MTRIHPGLPGVTVRPSNELFTDEEGNLHLGIHLTVTAEIFEQYRTGYRCLACPIASPPTTPRPRSAPMLSAPSRRRTPRVP